MEEIIEQSKICLNCKNKPCQKACPLGNDIPNALQCINNQDLKGAYQIFSKTSVLQSICGRICPHFEQCMGKCTRGIKQKPVDIGNIEAFVGDLAIKNNYNIYELNKDCANKKVAIVGSRTFTVLRVLHF